MSGKRNNSSGSPARSADRRYHSVVPSPGMFV